MHSSAQHELDDAVSLTYIDQTPKGHIQTEFIHEHQFRSISVHYIILGR